MRTDSGKGFDGITSGVVVQIAPDGVGSQGGIVGIRVGTVTAAIDVSVNAGTYAYGVTAPYFSLNIVTAIYVIYLTASYKQTGSKTDWEIVFTQAVFVLVGNIYIS